MKEYMIRVVFYTGFNHFYDKVIKRVSVMAENETEALDKVKKVYPCATNNMVTDCGIECYILGKWKKELKYEFVNPSLFTEESKYWIE